MRPAAAERFQTDGQSGDEGFAFAGFHFGDFAFIERHAAEELLVEVSHPERPSGGFAAQRENFAKQFVGAFPFSRRVRRSPAAAASSASLFAESVGASSLTRATRGRNFAANRSPGDPEKNAAI